MKRALFTITPLIVTVALALSVLLTPRGVQAATVAWSDSLAEVGMPTAPQMWQPSNWDIQTHIRDQNNAGDFIDSHLADHGSDCGAPPAQHTINTWQQVVFVCHSHVMTAISDSGYGEAVLTPDRMADWSNGPVTIGWSVSTQRTTSRDWIAIDLSPFAEQLALPFSEGDVDLAGMPQHYIELRSDFDDNQTHWHLLREQSGNDFGQVEADEYPYFESQTGIPMSATVRTPFELTISATGYTFRVGPGSAVAPGKVIFSDKWSKPLAFSRAVVQFEHHSYNPNKCDVTAITCKPDTWHWSDFSISSAVQYTLLRPVDHQVVTGSGVVTFAQPASSGSYLKFAGWGAPQVSFDGGKSYSNAVAAPLDPAYHTDPGKANSYMTPVPSGVSQILLRNTPLARDFSVVSLSVQNGTPPPTPTNTPQPTPTNTPIPATPTPSPAPSPTPITIQNVPCVVTLLGVTHSGTCSGTFTPGN